MTIRQKQSVFARHIGILLLYANALGYEVTLSEAYRPKVTAEYYAKTGKGVVNSLHRIRLAIDLNFFINGRYIKDGEELRQIGEWWESLHPDFRWGGNFKTKKDGNHFSMTHGGMA